MRGAAVARSIPEVLGKIAARGGAPQSNPGGHRARCARLSPINSGQIPSLDPGGKWSANTKEVRSAAPRSTDGLLSSLASLSNRWGIQLAGGEIRIQTRASESPKSSDLDCSDLDKYLKKAVLASGSRFANNSISIMIMSTEFIDGVHVRPSVPAPGGHGAFLRRHSDESVGRYCAR